MRTIIAFLPHIFAGGMVILGGPIGSGKTFAACVLGALAYRHEEKYESTDYDLSGHEVKQEEFRSVILHAKFIQARAVLKATFENEDYAGFAGLLIVDDLGREHFTDAGFGISEWDHFFDARYSRLLPTIVTTNLTEEEFVEKYNRRILDRLKECAKWAVFSGPSLRRPGNAL
jgi:DNA replication protein DnaC